MINFHPHDFLKTHFYWSRRSTTIDEAWWEQLQVLPFDTGRFPETAALIDCRLALDDEVRALEPLVVQPALRSLRREERTLVLKWLGHALGRAIRLHALSWSEWTRLLGEAIPGYWGRRATDRGTPTRIRDAYRLFFKWYERFGRSAPGPQRQRWLLCERSGGLGIVDTQAHTVYVDDDLDVRRAVGQRVYLVEFAERVRSTAASVWGLSRLSQTVSQAKLVELESEDSEMQRILARRIEALRPVLLALIRHRSEGDSDELEQRVRALSVHLVRRVEFVAKLKGIDDGDVHIAFCRPYTIQGAVAHVATDALESERTLYRITAQAMARTLNVREQHWVIRDLLQTEDVGLWRELLEEVGVSSAEIEDSIAALSAKQPSKDPADRGEGRGDATEMRRIAENTKPASPTATGRISHPEPTSAPSPVPSTRTPVVLKDGGSASYAINPASSTTAPVSHTTVARSSGAHRMEGWRPLPELDRQRIESESRAVCLRHLAQLGYEARERDITNPGFDIEANRGGQRLLIEVKGHLGQAQSVTLTRTQWETFCRCRRSPEAATWELWNIENLGSDAGEIVVTRYRDIPVEALTPDDFTVDLSFCERAQPL